MFARDKEVINYFLVYRTKSCKEIFVRGDKKNIKNNINTASFKVSKLCLEDVSVMLFLERGMREFEDCKA